MCLRGKVKMSSYDIPNEPKLNRLTDFFKVLGDPTRVKFCFACFNQKIVLENLQKRCRLQILPYLISCTY